MDKRDFMNCCYNSTRAGARIIQTKLSQYRGWWCIGSVKTELQSLKWKLNNRQCFNIEEICKTYKTTIYIYHDDVIKWKNFPRYWPFVRGIHRSPVNSPHKGQRRGALMFSSICVWINGWVNSREAGDLRRYRDHYDVTVMIIPNHIQRLKANDGFCRGLRYHWSQGCLSISLQAMVHAFTLNGVLMAANWRSWIETHFTIV